MTSCSQDELLREEEVQTKALLAQDEGQVVETRTFQRLTSVGAFATLGFLALAAGHQALGGAPSPGAQQRDGVVRLAEAPATSSGDLVAAVPPVATARPLAPVAPVVQVALVTPPTFSTPRPAEASKPSGEDTVDSEGGSGGKDGQTASHGTSKEASKKQDDDSEQPPKFTDSRHAGCDKQPKPSDDEEDAVPAAGSDGTVKLWGQCGGTGYDGDTECITGLACTSKPINGMKDYKQCKPDPDFNCQSAEGNTDMKCYYKVTWDMETGINTMPGMYHGLTSQSSFAEFQEQNFNFLPKKSACPAPCAPGTCYEVLAKEGCDSHNEWACEKDDHSLAFDCCCRKYHPNITKKWDVIKEEKATSKSEQPSLFCIAMIMPRSYEVGLMRGQFERGIGIFDATCDEWAVFSNESISLNCESAKKKYDTEVLNGTLEVKRGGDFKTALNTVVFQRFWDRVLEDARVWKHDWVVKVDPDTLFLPSRLKEMISSGQGAFGKKEPAGGMYINNCFLGMHGPIEVFNKAALGNYFNGKEKCSKGKPGTKGQEDVFLRECFKMLGVEKVDAFNILLEGENACKEMPSTEEPHARPPCFAPEAAFHPFKNIPSMMRCWAEAVSHHVAGQMAPATVPPSDENGRHES